MCARCPDGQMMMPAMQAGPACPLCAAVATKLCYQQAKGALTGRRYWHCQQCQLIHVAAADQLTAEQEKAEYDLHQNSPADVGYRTFLDRLVQPLVAQLQQTHQKPAQGLDFGCGPGPTLASMLNDHGHHCANYDLYYAYQPELLQHQYDFITCTEVVEHLTQPGLVMQQLLDCLKPGGWLAIMTQRWTAPERFAGWRYRHDPTHISFFHEQTFRCWAHQHGLQLHLHPRDVVLLRKPLTDKHP